MGGGNLQRALPALMITAGILTLIIGWESDWGQGFQGAVNVPAPPAATAVPLAVLKEFAPPGGVAAYPDIMARPLLTPTRQPAPPPPPPQARQSMPRGQFALMGTLLTEGKNYALLRETNGSKQTRVAQGDTIKNLIVDRVEPTQVVLRLGEETEVIPLKTYLPARTGAATGSAAGPQVPPRPARSPVGEATGGAGVPLPPQQPPPPRPPAPAGKTDPVDGRATNDGQAAGVKQSVGWQGLIDRPRRRSE